VLGESRRPDCADEARVKQYAAEVGRGRSGGGRREGFSSARHVSSKHCGSCCSDPHNSFGHDSVAGATGKRSPDSPRRSRADSLDAPVHSRCRTNALLVDRSPFVLVNGSEARAPSVVASFSGSEWSSWATRHLETSARSRRARGLSLSTADLGRSVVLPCEAAPDDRCGFVGPVSERGFRVRRVRGSPVRTALHAVPRPLVRRGTLVSVWCQLVVAPAWSVEVLGGRKAYPWRWAEGCAAAGEGCVG